MEMGLGNMVLNQFISFIDSDIKKNSNEKILSVERLKNLIETLDKEKECYHAFELSCDICVQ